MVFNPEDVFVVSWGAVVDVVDPQSDRVAGHDGLKFVEW